MFDNIRALLVDVCDIQRADVDVDATVIRDRRVAKYDDVLTSVACWFDPGSVNYVYNDQLGQVAIKSFTVYFAGQTDLREGDRLKRTVNSVVVYYLVEEVQDYTSQGMHMVARVKEKKYAMAAPS